MTGPITDASTVPSALAGRNWSARATIARPQRLIRSSSNRRRRPPSRYPTPTANAINSAGTATMRRVCLLAEPLARRQQVEPPPGSPCSAAWGDLSGVL